MHVRWFPASLVCHNFPVTKDAGTGKAKSPGGALVFEVGYHPRKKIHVIKLIFRTGQCTRVHRLGVQKRAKLEKRLCFSP